MNDSPAYRLTPLAEADLEEIWVYTARQWSLEQAEEYYLELVAAMDALAAGCKVGQQTEARAGYWKYKVGSHVLYFRHTDTSLDVIRILHERMDVDSRL